MTLEDGLKSGPGRLYGHIKGATMIRLKQKQAQNIIEYAIVVALVTAALSAMSTYVFRSVQSTQRAIDKEFIRQ